MRRYDTTFIINSQIGDDGIDTHVKEIANLITSTSGSILRENRIGNRRLAYEIDRQTHGYYVSLIHDSESDTLTKLDRHFKLGGNYLRQLTVRFDGDPYRKSITEIMMGFESEKRVRDEKSDGGAAPSSVPSTSSDTKVETSGAPAQPVAPTAVVPAAPAAPQPAPEVPVNDTGSASVTPGEPVAPAESIEGGADDESTL